MLAAGSRARLSRRPDPEQDRQTQFRLPLPGTWQVPTAGSPSSPSGGPRLHLRHQTIQRPRPYASEDLLTKWEDA